MRSTAYSVITTLLLLVPISAVPLMAIFGVPQFTPVVASPLADIEDEDWDKPARKRSRATARSDQSDDPEFDIPADDALNWEDSPQERPRPIKRVRTPSRPAPEPAEETPAEIADRKPPKGPPANRGRKRPPQPSPEEADEPFQTVGYDDEEREFGSVKTAGFMDEEEGSPAEKDAAAEPPNIPGYRRSRTGTNDESTPPPEKKSPRNNRSVSPAEPLTWQKAVQRLNDLGIRNFRLEPGLRPGEFTFTCSYTPSNSPHVTRKFEAEADDPLKAVAKVLAQVEEASQQRVMAAPRKLAESRERRGPE